MSIAPQLKDEKMKFIWVNSYNSDVSTILLIKKLVFLQLQINAILFSIDVLDWSKWSKLLYSKLNYCSLDIYSKRRLPRWLFFYALETRKSPFCTIRFCPSIFLEEWNIIFQGLCEHVLCLAHLKKLSKICLVKKKW